MVAEWFRVTQTCRNPGSNPAQAIIYSTKIYSGSKSNSTRYPSVTLGNVNDQNMFLFNVGPSKDSIFLTTIYGLYFSRDYTHYKLHFFFMLISCICFCILQVLECSPPFVRTFSLHPLKRVAHSTSPQRASLNNPHPYFHKCTQNDQ